MTSNDVTRRGVLTATACAALATGIQTAAAQENGPDYGGWFSDVSNFEGTADYTGESEVTVRVGTEGNNAYYAFSPPAVRVDPGTTVTWEWTGEGGAHNVHAMEGADFTSETTADEGFTFSHTFEEEGIVTYQCDPHVSLGMKGAVVVGGSGGVSPDTYESQQTTAAGGEGGGGGSDGDGGSGGGDIGIGIAALTTSLVVAFLSPIVFGVLYALSDDSDEQARSQH